MEYCEYEKISDDLMKSSMKDLFKDILKYSPSKLCGIFGNAIAIPIYTNLLSTAQYGTYMLSIAFLSFLCIIFSDWVGLSGLRFFKHHEIKQDVSKYFTTLFTLLLLNLSVMFVLAPIYTSTSWFAHFFKIPFKGIVAVLLLIIPVAFRALFFQILRAQIKPLSYTISTIINQFLTIGFSYIFMKYMHLGAYSILLGMGISIILVDFILLCQIDISKYFKLTKPKFDLFITLLKYGVPISITSLSLWGINQSNRFIMNGIHGIHNVGLVGVAYNATFSILMTAFIIVTFATIPRVYSLFEQNYDVRPLISKLTHYYVLFSLPVIILYSMHAKGVIYALSNAKFSEAYILVPYLSFSVFFLVLTEFTTLQYHLSKKTYLETIIRVISAVTGLVLNIILIRKMGLVGLGIATLTGNILYFLLSITVNVKGLSWQIPYKGLVKTFISYIVPFVIYYLVTDKISLNSWLECILLLFLYYLTYYAVCKAHVN